jgi:ribonuclease P protein component
MERARRLRKGTEFDTAYEKGTVISGPLLVVRCHANGRGVTRWGFAVGKRIARDAVDRNRMRRRLREIARGTLVAHGWDVIVTARQAGLAASHTQLRDALERALARAGVTGREAP